MAETRRTLTLVALAILPLCCGLPGGYLQDDLNVVIDPELPQASIQALLVDYWRSGERRPGPWKQALWRPLSLASFALEARLGCGPGLQRSVNLALHLANVLLLFALLKALLGDARAAWAGAAWFACHTALADGVLVLVGRADLLATSLILAACLALRAGRPGWTLLFAGLAPLAKETGFFVAPILLALAFWSSRDTSFRSCWQAHWRALLAVGLVLAAAFAARWYVVGAATTPEHWTPLAQWPLLQRLGAATRIACLYLELSLFPISPSLDYSYLPLELVADGPGVASVLGGLCLWALAALAWRRGAAGFFALFVLLAWFPISNLLPIGAVAGTRFMILPAVGLAGLWACSLREVLRRKPWARVAWVLVLLVLAGLTGARAYESRDQAVFWQRMHRRHPAASKTGMQVMLALARSGQREQGIAYGRRMLVDRFEPGVCSTLARLLWETGTTSAQHEAADILELGLRGENPPQVALVRRLLAWNRKLGRQAHLLALYDWLLEIRLPGALDSLAFEQSYDAGRTEQARRILALLRAAGQPLSAGGERRAGGL